jgi:CHAT domain-containing protein
VSLATSAAAQVDEAAAGFVAALTANNINAFDSVAAGDATALEGLSTVRNMLERYDCIQVAGYRTTVLGPNRIRIDLDATATTHGRIQGRVPFPRSWIVGLSCEGRRCRIASAAHVEDIAAADLMSRPESDWRTCPVDVEMDVDDEARFLCALSNRMGFDDVALRRRAYDFVLDRAAALGDVHARVWTLGSCALDERGGNYDLAMSYLHQALDLARSSGDPDEIAATHFLLGTTSWLGGHVPEGLDELRQASAMIGRLDDPRTALKAMAMRTFIAQQAGDLRAAIVAANELIAGSRKYRWPQGEAAAGLYLGTLHASMGDAPAAAFYFRGALQKAIEIREGRLISMALEDCADVESALHHYDTAIALSRRDVTRYGKTLYFEEEAIHWASLSSYLRQAGRLKEARDALAQARALVTDASDSHTKSTLFDESSRLREAEGDLHGALDDALRAVDFARKGGILLPSFSTFDFRIHAAQVQLTLGHDTEAIALLREGVSVLESERRAYAGGAVSSELFMESGTEGYRMLVDLLVRHGRPHEAFEYSERMRGRALGDVLAQGKIDRSATMTEAERAKERELEGVANDPKAAAAKREEARAALERLETELVLIHPTLRLRRPLENDFRPRLPAKLADGVVVEYVVGPSRTIVFTVTSAGVKAHVIAMAKKALERRVTRLTSAIAHRDYGYAADARSLYRTLLGPVAGDLHGKRSICIVPDGALWRVPFQALLDDAGNPLIASAAVSYAPSLTTLRLALDRRQRLEHRPPSIAAIGNSAVAEADREIRTIASLYGRHKVDLGPGATPRCFHRDAADASVVHVAAHAVIDDGAPMYSALMLAPRDHNDGALEARDIAGLSLHAHTAVLSACETAGGKVGSGEGIIGLSWAFLLAGCPTTVVSQWKTSSAPNATLMIDFHRHLIRDRDPAESLREAELTLARDPRYHHPFYWAAFVVMGAP